MGVLTFEMLTGRLPFIGSNRMEVAYSTVNAPIPSAVKLNAALPDELDQLLAKVLAKDPAQRPQTVRDLLALMAPSAAAHVAGSGTGGGSPARCHRAASAAAPPSSRDSGHATCG